MDLANQDEVIRLTQELVRISSTNPTLGQGKGTGEELIAKYVGDWLEFHGFTVQYVHDKEDEKRVSVIGTAKGKGGGKTLLFNGHLDTVSVTRYSGDAFSAHISSDGKRLYGRGAADMKGGLAAAMIAAAAAKSKNTMRGDVVIAAVADEEDASRGSLAVLNSDLPVDAAIFPEPTQENIVICHRGFSWIEITCTGSSAHGSRYDLGRDAICDMGIFLSKLRKYDQILAKKAVDQLLGRGSAHAGIIKGGVETSTYPAQCTLTIERRTLPGESENVFAEIQSIIDDVKLEDPSIQLSAKLLLTRPPLAAEKESSGGTFADLVMKHAQKSLHSEVKKVGGPFWTDAALFHCPSVVFGPSGFGIHEEVEWVSIDSLRKMCCAYYSIAMDFCQ